MASYRRHCCVKANPLRCCTLQCERVLLLLIVVIALVTICCQYCFITSESPLACIQGRAYNPSRLINEDVQLLGKLRLRVLRDERLGLIMEDRNQLSTRTDSGQIQEHRLRRDQTRRRLNLDELKSILLNRKTSLKPSQIPEDVNSVEKDGRPRDSVPSETVLLEDKVIDGRSNVLDDSELDKHFEEEAVDEKDEPFQLMSVQMESEVQHIDRQALIQSNEHQQSRVLLEKKSAPVGEISKTVSKKKSVNNNYYLSLLEGYPLFDSPYPPPVVDGYPCRQLDTAISLADVSVGCSSRPQGEMKPWEMGPYFYRLLERAKDGMCSEFLQSTDLHAYKSCLARQRSVSGYANSEPGPCHFINGSRRAPVALASLPGSGNTWVRGLLEKATGVCTGAIYCDKSLRASGMNGESVKSGAVIAVKTHKSTKVAWTDRDNPQPQKNEKVPVYGAAILVVRNPYRAFIAEWNRLNSRKHLSNITGSNVHVMSTSGQENFGNNAGWKSFIKRKLPVWQSYFQEWVVEGHRNNKSVLVVRYEDLKLDTFKEIKRMLDFLHFQYKDQEIHQRLADNFTTFLRHHSENDFQHFTSEQQELIDNGISESIGYLDRYNNGETFGIEEYIGTIG